MEHIRDLVREEIAKLLNDDALFHQRDFPGLAPEKDYPGDIGPSHAMTVMSCPICGTKHSGPCHNPEHSKCHTSDEDDGRNLSYGHTKSTDSEGRMSRKQLYYIAKGAQSLHDILRDDDDLPEWVQSKISRAAEKIRSAHDYIEYKLRSKK